MKRPLSREEAALWARVARTVRPLNPPRNREGDHAKHDEGGHRLAQPQGNAASPLNNAAARRGPPPRTGEDRALDRSTLDAGWDRKLARGIVQPDFTLDLHGASLEAAHARLDHGLALALAQGARVVLLITGRPRPSDGNAARGERRGAIRAKFVDWLAAGPHASRIAAIRPAHPRHGGAGAVYVVLRRPSRRAFDWLSPSSG